MPRFRSRLALIAGLALAAVAAAGPAHAAGTPVVNVSATSGQTLEHATSADIGHTITLRPGIILHGNISLAESSVTVHFTAPGGTTLAPNTEPYCTVVRPTVEEKCRWPAFLTGMGGADTFYYWLVRVTIRSNRITPGRFWFELTGATVPNGQNSAPLVFLMNGKMPTPAPTPTRPHNPTPTKPQPTTTTPPTPSGTPSPTSSPSTAALPVTTPMPPAAQTTLDASPLGAVAGGAAALLIAGLLIAYLSRRSRSRSVPEDAG